MMSSAVVVLTMGELATRTRIREAVSDIRDAAVAGITDLWSAVGPAEVSTTGAPSAAETAPTQSSTAV